MLADRHITSLMHSARTRTREGNWIASLNIYQRIIEERPDFHPAYCELARLYLDRDDFDGARKLMTKVLDADAENTEAHFLLGVMEYIEGNFESALRSYRIVEKVDGLDSNLSMNIALVCEALGLHEDAIKNLEHAIRHGEVNAKVYEVLSDLYRSMGDLEKAVRVLEKAVRKYPAEATLYFALGLVQVQAGKFLLAETSFQNARRLSPEDTGPLDELVRLYSKLQRIEDLVVVLTRLTEIDPENQQNWLALARAHFSLENYEKSLEVIKEAKRCYPDNASINKEHMYIKSKTRQMKGGQEAPGDGNEQEKND